MQPDARATASVQLVTLVRIADRQCSGSAEIRQSLARQTPRNVTPPQRSFLVAFLELVYAQLALADVVVGHEFRHALTVLIAAPARAPGPDHQRILLIFP